MCVDKLINNCVCCVLCVVVCAFTALHQLVWNSYNTISQLVVCVEKLSCVIPAVCDCNYESCVWSVCVCMIQIECCVGMHMHQCVGTVAWMLIIASCDCEEWGCCVSNDNSVCCLILTWLHCTEMWWFTVFVLIVFCPGWILCELCAVMSNMCDQVCNCKQTVLWYYVVVCCVYVIVVCVSKNENCRMHVCSSPMHAHVMIGMH